MTILIANIGTSDLAIKIGEYYIPVGFDRSEPNINDNDLDDLEKEVWDRDVRQEYVISKLCQELGVKVDRNKFAFRELTEKILDRYQNEEQKWHQLINPCRILGAIEHAYQKFNINLIYLFVTDQPEEIIDSRTNTDKPNPGYATDSIHLFGILKKWIEIRFDHQVKVVGSIIPKDISAIDRDKLLGYYYNFFVRKDIRSHEKIIVSIKGGTPQMQEALRIQSFAYPGQLLFIEPHLSVKRLLNGEYSECKLNSYWRYQRTQKYEAVRQLLERWDFDGAIEILKDWQKYLKFLIEQEVIDRDIENSSELIRLVLQRLDIGRTYFNLDSDLDNSLSYRIEPGDDLGNIAEIKDQYSKVLNLYTQSMILWDLNQFANFSFRMSSLCEEILHDSLDNLGAAKYFNKQRYPHDWYLTKSQVESTLWDKFYQLEIQANPHTQLKYWKWNEKPSYKLPGRFSKRNFLYALIEFRGNSIEQTAWQAIENHLIQLDYWIDLRNSLTHSAQGFSKKSMADSLAHDRNLYQRGDRDRTAERANSACNRDDILPTLTSMMAQMSVLLGRDESPYIGLQEPYYIYSDIKQWVLDKLQQEGLG
jgi:hypothetical protein